MQCMHAKFNEPLEMQPILVEHIYHKVGVDILGPLQDERLWKPLHQCKSTLHDQEHGGSWRSRQKLNDHSRVL